MIWLTQCFTGSDTTHEGTEVLIPTLLAQRQVPLLVQREAFAADQHHYGGALVKAEPKEDSFDIFLAEDVPLAERSIRLMMTSYVGSDSVGSAYWSSLPWASKKHELSDTLQEAFGLHMVSEINIHQEGHALRGFIARAEDGEVIVAIRGTEGWQDIFSDIDTRQKEWDPQEGAGMSRATPTLSSPTEAPLLVHEGFAELTETAVHEVLYNCRGASKVTLVGHSLGGACARLMTDKLLACQHEQSISIDLVTAGCPAVGNTAFASRWAAQVSPHLQKEIHLVHASDVVPHLPPNADWLPKYEHTSSGHWRRLLDGGRSPCRLHPGALEFTLYEDWQDMRSDNGVSNHSLEQYLKALTDFLAARAAHEKEEVARAEN